MHRQQISPLIQENHKEDEFTGRYIAIYDITLDREVQGVIGEHVGGGIYKYSVNYTCKPIMSFEEGEGGIVESSVHCFLDVVNDEYYFITELDDEYFDTRQRPAETRFFVGSPTRKKKDRAIELGWGSMETPEMFRNTKKMHFILDNGMFSYFHRGVAFDDKLFVKRLDTLFKDNITPEFVVLPDVIGNWEETKKSSISWLHRLLERYDDRFDYGIVLQEGCTTDDLEDIFQNYPEIKWIFIGGKSKFNGFGKPMEKGPEWKFTFGEKAIPVARKYGRKVHVGRVSSIRKVNMSAALGADTMDTSQPNFSPEQFERFERGLKNLKRQSALPLFD